MAAQSGEGMPNGDTDPRVYFAAERTLLAWVRTGIGVMAFGFIVARFGLVLRLLRAQSGDTATHGASLYLGVTLVVLGVLATAAGAVLYRWFCQRLRPEELPSGRAQLFPLTLAWALVGLGMALAATLLV